MNLVNREGAPCPQAATGHVKTGAGFARRRRRSFMSQPRHDTTSRTRGPTCWDTFSWSCRLRRGSKPPNRVRISSRRDRAAPLNLGRGSYISRFMMLSRKQDADQHPELLLLFIINGFECTHETFRPALSSLSRHIELYFTYHPPQSHPQRPPR
jgi:hypothetical protein